MFLSVYFTSITFCLPLVLFKCKETVKGRISSRFLLTYSKLSTNKLKSSNIKDYGKLESLCYETSNKT